MKQLGGGFVNVAVSVACFGREHQLHQRCVVNGETDIRASDEPKPFLEGGIILQRGANGIGEPLESAHCESIQQRLSVDEVRPWRSVAHAGPAGNLSERQRVRAVGAQQLFCVLQ